MSKIDNLALLKTAMQVLNRDADTVEAAATTTSPVAKSRKALEFLTFLNEKKVAELLPENMRDFTADLFDWDTKPGEQSKVTRPLIRAVTEVLNTDGKYAQAVEGIAFAVAATPLLDANSIIELVKDSITVDTAFAPERYTIQLTTNMRRVLGGYNNARRLVLLRSLWKQQHEGRWWDIADGGNEVAAQLDEDPYAENTDDEIIEMFVNGSLPVNAYSLNRVKALGEDDRIMAFLEKYMEDFTSGKQIDPDASVLASGLSWLRVFRRAEAPTSSIIRSLANWLDMLEEDENNSYSLPKKPKRFSDLFPGGALVSAGTFPLPVMAFAADGAQLGMTGFYLRLVKNEPMLSANRRYMSNCTYSYKSGMEKGSYVLFQIIKNGESDPTYNASASQRGSNGKWSVGEINSRFNGGNVPDNIRSEFKKFAEIMSGDLQKVPSKDAKAIKDRVARFGYRF